MIFDPNVLIFDTDTTVFETNTTVFATNTAVFRTNTEGREDLYFLGEDSGSYRSSPSKHSYIKL